VVQGVPDVDPPLGEEQLDGLDAVQLLDRKSVV